MLIVHVFIHVKEECIDAFKEITVFNAGNSIKEPGIVRFDVMQQQDDPSRFVLVEVYKTIEDTARHKETTHYNTWRDTVEDMMAEPRYSIRYSNIFPDDPGWSK